MVMSSLHTKLYVPSSRGSLLIAINSKTKYKIHTAAMFLFYIQQNYLNKSFIFFEDLLPYIISVLQMKRCLCRFHLKSSCVHHVVTSDYAKLQITRLRCLTVAQFS